MRLARFLPLVLAATALSAQAAPELPRVVTKDGRSALFVDGAPFLMLGAQANNSSNYPAALPKVWPVLERLNANTLEIPVAWEQIEPVEGKFDFSYLDALLKGAREHNLRLVLLWFGAWKNTSANYAPDWVRTDNTRFPRMRTRDGKPHYALSPHARTTLEADKRAFVALMQRLKAIDPQNTVILVQVENETGSYTSPRDFSPEAQKLFAQPIPAPLATRTGKSGTWAQAFGKLADTAFNAWYVGRYVDEVAAAGQAVKNLPMYANAALSDPFGPAVSGGASGGPDWPVIDVWRAAAPHIALVAPDIYNRDPRAYAKYLDLYARPDNPLLIPETGSAADYARFLWPVLGKGAIGFSPFGFDATGYSNYPLGAKEMDEATIEAFAAKYRLLAPMARTWAKIAFEHPVWGVAKMDDAADQSTTFGRWKITAQYDLWRFGERDWTWIKTDPSPTKGQPVGGALVAQLGPDQFLLTGTDVRLRVSDASGGNGMMLRVEEGHFDGSGNWVFERVWNGDQTDYGLNFTGNPVWLKVTMGAWK